MKNIAPNYEIVRTFQFYIVCFFRETKVYILIIDDNYCKNIKLQLFKTNSEAHVCFTLQCAFHFCPL